MRVATLAVLSALLVGCLGTRGVPKVTFEPGQVARAPTDTVLVVRSESEVSRNWIQLARASVRVDPTDDAEVQALTLLTMKGKAIGADAFLVTESETEAGTTSDGAGGIVPTLQYLVVGTFYVDRGE